MKKQTVEARTMERYLLGEMSETERLALEEEYFSKPDLYEQLQNTEDELIRRYVGHELSAEERRLFEQRLLSRPWHRDKIKLAQALQIYLTAKPAEKKSAAFTLFEKTRTWLRPFELKPVFTWSFATAVMAMIFVSSWLLFETKNLQTQLSQVEMERRLFTQREQELRRQTDAQREQNKNLLAQLQGEQNRRAELESKFSQSPQPPRELLTLNLTPGVSRDAKEPHQRQRWQISSETQLVRLQLYIGSAASYESFRVILETAAGDTILTQYQLAAQRTEKGRAVALMLPANLLSYDDYLITVKGVLPSGEIEEVSNYFLSVAKE